MPLKTPSFQEYQESATQIQNFLVGENVDYCIYGSFINPGKLRPGLSDIDVFTIENTDELCFSIEITEVFGDVKRRIETLGIPLQINWTTRGQLENKFFSPDLNYIEEVKRGIHAGTHSAGFKSLINNSNSRDEVKDDGNMARYFHRKGIEIGVNIGEVFKIIQKDKNKISKNEQKKLWQFWDSFKKMLSLYTITIRIGNGKSIFSKPDEEIIKLFKVYFDVSGINAEKYLALLKKVRNIEDWYEYLKNGGLIEIKEIYNQIYKPFTNAIGKKLNQ